MTIVKPLLRTKIIDGEPVINMYYERFSTVIILFSVSFLVTLLFVPITTQEPASVTSG